MFAAVAIGTGLVAVRVRPERVVRLVEATMHASSHRAAAVDPAARRAGGLAGSLGLDVVLGAFTAGLIVN